MKRLAIGLPELERLTSSELKRVWRHLLNDEPPRFSRDLLRRHLAYLIQEQTEGGLSQDARRKIRGLQAGLGRSDQPRRGSPIALDEGTRLVREWHGRTYLVVVSQEGLIFDGRRFGSLTQIAREITGSHWPGPRFFGLRKRRAPTSVRSVVTDA